MSGETHEINLPPIRLDLKEGRLWNGERPVDLRPKTWELIRYMVERPGELLSKQELIDAVWPDTIVTEASLNQACAFASKSEPKTAYICIPNCPIY